MTARIEAAWSFAPADLLAGRVPAVDFHVHTTHTDGTASVRECVDAARGEGLEALGFAEHVSRNAAWMDGWYEAYRREVRATAEETGMTVCAGIEAKVLDDSGTLNVREEDAASADFVTAVVHAYPDATGSPTGDLDAEYARIREVSLSLAALEAPRIDVLGHCGAVYGLAFGPLPLEDFERVIRRAAERGVAFELNARYHTGLLKQLLEICKTHGARVSLGSDAHATAEIGAIGRLLLKELRS
jgi:histidinol phosphatase-like PHP family hydrolase